MKKLLTRAVISATFVAVSILYPKEIRAIENPLSVPNNSYGIHILDENDLEDAAVLVNSNGGDWGYVTLVIRKDERDTKRWQEVFNKMRRLHLIPIIRIATRQQDHGWEKPNLDEVDGWVSFLSSLNWVIKNRYVIIGNEPNHAKEWGGEIKPEEYAQFLELFSNKLKAVSNDFFILPAGFDASAPTNKTSMSEDEFLKKMLQAKPNIFDYIDGWTSHSYPNPDFSGSEIDKGRGTIQTYKWELKSLQSLGITKKLPVFITETGWTHNGSSEKNGYVDVETVGNKLKAAYEIAWKDERIVAITPFILNYQSEPFDVFSWKKKDGNFYNFYYEIQKLPKKSGKPTQVAGVDILSIVFPPVIPGEGKLSGIVIIKNTGQQIWEGKETIYAENRGYEVTLEPKAISGEIEPQDKTLAIIRVKVKKE